LRNSLPVLGVVVLTELWRYALVKRIGQHRGMLALIALAFTALYVMAGIKTYNLAVPMEVFTMVGQLILGGLAMNVMLTFVAYKSDFRPTLTYAAVMALYPIVAPIIPDLGPFIYACLMIMLPTLLFMRFNEFFVTKRPIPGRHQRSGRLIRTAPVVAVLTVIVILVSGIFRYWAMAIGSDSMRPNISTGDVVIIDKDFGEARDIAAGTVVAFRHDGQIIAHRLTAVKDGASGLTLQTKGDNNEKDDAWTVRKDDLVGVVLYKIPVIGWPTIWLDRTF
jgi:signal peptidase